MSPLPWSLFFLPLFLLILLAALWQPATAGLASAVLLTGRSTRFRARLTWLLPGPGLTWHFHCSSSPDKCQPTSLFATDTVLLISLWVFFSNQNSFLLTWSITPEMLHLCDTRSYPSYSAHTELTHPFFPPEKPTKPSLHPPIRKLAHLLDFKLLEEQDNVSVL